MASPKVSALADSQSPIASVKRPRSQVVAALGSLPYDQLLSVASDSCEDKTEQIDTTLNLESKIAEKKGSPVPEDLPQCLFSPLLTIRDDQDRSGSEEESVHIRKDSKAIPQPTRTSGPKKAERKNNQDSKNEDADNAQAQKAPPVVHCLSDSAVSLHDAECDQAARPQLMSKELVRSSESSTSSASRGDLDASEWKSDNSISLEEEPNDAQPPPSYASIARGNQAPPPEEATAQSAKEQEFNPYLFMQRLPPYDLQVSMAHRRRRLLGPQKSYSPLHKKDQDSCSSTPQAKTKSREENERSKSLSLSCGTGATRRERERCNSSSDSQKNLTKPTGPGPGSPIAARPTLVLDLDETLVHCTVQPSDTADIVFPVLFNGVNYQVHVHKRPHLDHFLSQVRELFEVVVFTASQRVYADALLDILDPDHDYIEHRLFREDCLEVDKNFLKDLNILGRDLSRVILVDNSPYAYGYQVDNGVPIVSWFEDEDDKELLKLLPFLETLAKVKDVRPIIRKQFQTHMLVQNA